MFLVEASPEDLSPGRLDDTTLERPWVSTKLWSFDEADAVAGGGGGPEAGPGVNRTDAAPRRPRTMHLRLRSRDATGPGRTYVLQIDRAAVGRPRTAEGPVEGPVLFTLDRPGATFTFTGGELPDQGGGAEPVHAGLVRISFQREFLRAIEAADERATPAQAILAAALGLTADDLAEYARLPRDLTLADMLDLGDAGVSPAMAHQLHAAGYRFDVPALITLAEAQVPVDEAVALRRAGFEFTAEQLVQLHEQGVTPAYAEGMKAAGFADDVAMLVRLHEAGVTPRYAARLRELGVAEDLPTLLRLHLAEVSPAEVATFQEAGYDFAAADLILLKRRGVRGEDALAYREAGYDFDMDALLKLARWEVPVHFTVALMAEGFEPLSVEEIVNLHLRRVTPEMVRDLRRPRTSGHAAADGP